MPFTAAPSELATALGSFGQALFPDPTRRAQAGALGAQARNYDATAGHTIQQTSDLVAKANARARLAGLQAQFAQDPAAHGPALIAALTEAGEPIPAALNAGIAVRALGGQTPGSVADAFVARNGVNFATTPTGYGQGLDNARAVAGIQTAPALLTAQTGRDQATSTNYFRDPDGTTTYLPLGQQPPSGGAILPGAASLDLEKSQNTTRPATMAAELAARQYSDGRTQYTNLDTNETVYLPAGQTPPAGGRWVLGAQAVDLAKTKEQFSAPNLTAQTGATTAANQTATYVLPDGTYTTQRTSDPIPAGARPPGPYDNMGENKLVQYSWTPPNGIPRTITLRANEKPPQGAVLLSGNPANDVVMTGAYGQPAPGSPGAPAAPLSQTFTDAFGNFVRGLGVPKGTGQASNVSDQEGQMMDTSIDTMLKNFNKDRSGPDARLSNDALQEIRAEAARLYSDRSNVTAGTYNNMSQAVASAWANYIRRNPPPAPSGLSGYFGGGGGRHTFKPTAGGPGGPATAPTAPSPTTPPPAGAGEPLVEESLRVPGVLYNVPGRGPMEWGNNGRWVAR